MMMSFSVVQTARTPQVSFRNVYESGDFELLEGVMAGRGPAPKDPSERARRNKPDSLTVIESDDQLRGPELPESFDWPTQTRAWWETWRHSPQAQTFTETDWSFLLDTAVMHAEFWMGARNLAGELRLRVAKFGATPEDRARLKLSIGEPTGRQSARLQAKDAGDRRGRLLRAVGEES